MAGGACAECGKKTQTVQRASLSPHARADHLTKSPLLAAERVEREGEVPLIIHEVLRSPGQPLSPATRDLMESRFGHDFSQVRVHTNGKAAESARAVNALAYTVGREVVFGTGQYVPATSEGQRLLAHELTHVLQQSSVNIVSQTKLTTSSPGDAGEREADRIVDAVTNTTETANHLRHLGITNATGVLQRTIGDGHDLTSPRFSLLVDLEAAYDDETVIRKNRTGRGVQAIQQALYDLGYPLPASGADGDFGNETEAAVKAFQRDHPPLVDDGEVGEKTMAALDARFGVPVLPAPAARSAPWTESCVRSVLCPWSPHTIDVLRTRITLKSFDSISWADEEWDGAAWIPAPFPGGGYNDLPAREIGVLNSNCEEMSETLYHEVLHAEQPTTHGTTRERESYAYRIGEEFSIAMGLGGRPSLRSTDPRGRQFADPVKVGAFVAATYPGVPTGAPGDEIIGKAAALGDVLVERPDGSIYTRPAAVGEKVPGPMTTVAEVTHPTAGWTCP